MTAGIAAKMMLSEAIRQRPASWERSSRSIRRAEDSVNRRTRAGPVPIVLASWTPLIDSPSSMATLRSASSRCCSVVMARRILATLRVKMMAGGMTTSEMSDSRQDRATMAMAVATAVVRFEAMEVAVEVTTASMPPMSFWMRDCTSPVRVRVKKAIDWRCRWVKTLVRSPCMTCWPTLVLIQVWMTHQGRPARHARAAHQRLHPPAAPVDRLLHPHPHRRGAIPHPERHRRHGGGRDLDRDLHRLEPHHRGGHGHRHGRPVLAAIAHLAGGHAAGHHLHPQGGQDAPGHHHRAAA